MDSKRLVWLGAAVGSAVGGYLPLLWGADALSLSSLICGTLGAIVGIYLGFKVSQ